MSAMNELNKIKPYFLNTMEAILCNISQLLKLEVRIQHPLEQIRSYAKG